MHITDKTNDTGSSAQSKGRWSGLPRSAGSKAGLMVRCLFSPEWGKKTQCLHSPWQRVGQASSLGEFKTLYPKRASWGEKNPAVHKWLKPGVRLSRTEQFPFRLATIKWIHTCKLIELHSHLLILMQPMHQVSLRLCWASARLCCKRCGSVIIYRYVLVFQHNSLKSVNIFLTPLPSAV